MKECVLIETKDKRKFLTHKKNFNQLIEFSKTFNAKLSIVKTKNTEILELEDLAKALCSSDYVIEKTNRSRNEILQIANKVKDYVSDQFQKRNEVSLKDLKKKFDSYNLTDAALCNHIRRVKKEFQKNGFEFLKIKAGQYRVR